MKFTSLWWGLRKGLLERSAFNLLAVFSLLWLSSCASVPPRIEIVIYLPVQEEPEDCLYDVVYPDGEAKEVKCSQAPNLMCVTPSDFEQLISR